MATHYEKVILTYDIALPTSTSPRRRGRTARTFAGAQRVRAGRGHAGVKRLFDLIAAGTLLLVLLPVILITALLVGLQMGRPLLFRQVRPGLGERPFEMLKFRTMRDAYDSGGNLLADAERLTRLGRFLRSSSIDELPELWNVLAGDMSLVGPRPLLMEYLPRYTAEQARRHEVRPGITGWAQVNGRNALGWEQKFALDIWYVDNRSLWLDIKILWMTVAKVLRREGIAADGEATMPKFEGAGKG
jgi:lipopolysaccharide/colanic/teichoic acid biosynthesis glycosyltransferase